MKLGDWHHACRPLGHLPRSGIKVETLNPGVFAGTSLAPPPGGWPLPGLLWPLLASSWPLPSLFCPLPGPFWGCSGLFLASSGLFLASSWPLPGLFFWPLLLAFSGLFLASSWPLLASFGPLFLDSPKSPKFRGLQRRHCLFIKHCVSISFPPNSEFLAFWGPWPHGPVRGGQPIKSSATKQAPSSGR